MIYDSEFHAIWKIWRVYGLQKVIVGQMLLYLHVGTSDHIPEKKKKNATTFLLTLITCKSPYLSNSVNATQMMKI